MSTNDDQQKQIDTSVRYKRLEKRGEGTYGVVYKAEDLQTNKIVALKIMKLEQEEDGIPPTTLREMSILRSVSHPNIVKLEDVIIKQGSLTLVFEYLEFDLRRFLNHSRKTISMKLLKSYAFQMLAGINALHSHRIIHRDIKPDNILLNKDGFLKICDFGLARYFTIPMRKYSANVVSQWYRAPELLFGVEVYGLPIDIWSAGCILAEMCCGIPLFTGDSDVDQLHKIFNVLGTPTKEECPMMKDEIQFPNYPKKKLEDVIRSDDLLLIDLIEKMLVFDPDKRINVQDAMKHPFFDTLSPLIRKMSAQEFDT
ncbi:Cyclin-dependent kinase A-2 [Tritrichomonas foetus]|uniref:cyclin-dependent kinase n=1 Tax=Tritrichomonas foetus TaxID=1144522 RepID=A0A1J4JQY8_9EUKA|nr:Cyclin-dependent kinase A-2 [Tritrichomonas foetus]|eukprot:OHS99933.1 Cyclin-dependent kinase A-2 [Tritrichomonas foetus]